MNIKEIRDFIYSLWQMFRWKTIGLIGLIIISGLCEGIGIMLLFPLFSLLGIGAEGGQQSLPFVGNLFSNLGINITLYSVTILLASIFTLQYSFFLLQSWCSAKLQNQYVANIQSELFKNVIYAKWFFFVNKRRGDLSNIILGEAGRASNAFFSVVQFVVNLFLVLIYLGVSFYISIPATFSLLLTIILIVFFTYPIVKGGRKVGQSVSKNSNELMSCMHEVFSGMKLVKASAAEGIIWSKFLFLITNLKKLGVIVSFHPNLLRAVFELIAILIILTGIVVGVEHFALDIAVLMVVMVTFVRLYPRFANLQQCVHLLNMNLPAVKQIRNLLEQTTAEQEDSRDNDVSITSELSGSVSISIKNLVVSYSKTQVLKDVSLNIESGRVTAIVGPSGAGKTTLLDCLLRLVEPDSGEILINSKLLSDLNLKDWRRSVGYVAQETILFNDSIEENIRWTNVLSDEDEIKQAAMQAQASEFIDTLENTYKTTVGDSGVKLSGGQKQRIGLARALVGKKSLLIFDEVTSALDAKAEKAVMQTIEALKDKYTVVIISHRLSTIVNADNIYVLESGEIKENGDFEGLISQGGLFKQMWEIQSREPD